MSCGAGRTRENKVINLRCHCHGGGGGERTRTHVDETSRAEEEVVLLELLRMDDAEVATDADTLCLADICTLELLVLFLGEIGHGALELGDDHAGDEWTRGKDAKLGLASVVRITRGVGDLDRARWEVELKVPGSVAVRGDNSISRRQLWSRRGVHTLRTR